MRNKKKIVGMILLSGVAFISNINSYAAVAGPYAGVQLGYGSVYGSGISSSDMNALLHSQIPSFTETSYSSHADGNGVGGRIYAGFQFNCFFAAEMGWAKFPHLPVHANVAATDVSTGLPITINHVSGSIATDAFDLVGKVILPLRYFNLYGKLGAAYIEARSKETINIVEGGISAPAIYSNINHRYYPTFGLGISYDFTLNFGSDLSWNRIQKVGGNQVIGSTDLLSLGLYYNFGGANNCPCYS